MPDREPIKALEQYLKDKFGEFVPWIPKLSLNILSLSSGSGGWDSGLIQGNKHH